MEEAILQQDEPGNGIPATTFVLDLTEEEWKENQQMGAFIDLDISYTKHGGTYKVELTLDQYEKYKKNCGMYIKYLCYSI